MLSLRKIPIENIKAHPVRTVIVLLLALAQAACVFGGVMAARGIQRDMELAEARLGADLVVYPKAIAVSSKINMKRMLMQGTPVKVYKSRSLLSKLEDCGDIEAASRQIYISDTLPDGKDIWIVGIEPDRDFVIRPWLEAVDFAFPVGTVAVGSKVETTASDGEKVTLFQRDWAVGARLKETGSELDYAVFTGMDTLGEVIAASKAAGVEDYGEIDPQTVFSSVLVRVKDKSRTESAMNWINRYVRKVKAGRSQAALTKTAESIGTASKAAAAAFGGAWLLMLMASGIVSSMLMKERKRELYVWHTVGASQGLIMRVMLREVFILQLSGAVCGVLAAAAVLKAAGGNFLPLGTFGVSDMLISFGAAVLLTVGTGLFGTWNALRKAEEGQKGQMLLTT